MNEDVDKALAALIEKVADGTDFLVAEAPEVIQQLLLWHWWASLGQMLAAILVPSILAWVSYKLFRLYGASQKQGSTQFLLRFLFSTCIGITSSLIIVLPVTLSFDWVKISIAPKVWLLEYAARFL